MSCASLAGGCEGFGALLAHSMGLGKTLTTIALVDALLRSQPLRAAAAAGKVRGFRRVLVVAPATVLDNWLDEVDKWASDAPYGTYRVYAEDTVKKRLATLREWQGDRAVRTRPYEMEGARDGPGAQARPLLREDAHGAPVFVCGGAAALLARQAHAGDHAVDLADAAPQGRVAHSAGVARPPPAARSRLPCRPPSQALRRRLRGDRLPGSARERP